MKMQMIPPVLNDTGDCCCQCPPSGPDGWCHCNNDYNGKGDDIENAITCDLVWTERQPNGRKKYFKVVSGSSKQNMPVVLPTASLTKRGVVQLTNDLSDREDLALTPKTVKGVKEQLDRETAERISSDNILQEKILGFIRYFESKPTVDATEENVLMIYPSEDNTNKDDL